MAALILGVTGLVLAIAALMPRALLDFMPWPAAPIASLLAGPVVLLAIALGLVGFKRKRRRAPLVGAVLGCVAVVLFVQEVPLRLRSIDRSSTLLWRVAHPATHEMVLELEPDAGFPLSAGDLSKAAEALSSRLRYLGRFHAPRGVAPNRIVIPVTARDAAAYQRMGPPLTGGYVTFHLVHPESDRMVTEASEPGFSCPEGCMMVRKAEQAYVVNKEPDLRDSVRSAEVLALAGEPPSVSVTFDDRGSKALSDITARNRGRRLAVLLDGEVIVVPVIEEPIGNGQVSIRCSGAREAADLSLVLRSGGIPCPVRMVEIRKVRQP